MPVTSPIGIFTTDVNLNITSWNDWLVSVTGLSEEEIRGSHITRIIPDIEKRGLYNRFLKVLTEGIVDMLAPVFHHYLIRVPLAEPVKNFTVMQQRVTIAPLSEEETIHGTLVTIEDVTNDLSEEVVHGSAESALQSLSSEDWTKRKDVATSLASSGKTILFEVLRKIKFDHANLNILSSAMKVISMSDEDLSEFLIEFLNSDDNELRIYASQLLGEKNSPYAVEALIRALDDEDLNVKYHAIESLGKLKAVQAVDRLAEIAVSRDFFTAFPAIDALRAIGNVRTSRLIYELADDVLLGDTVLETLGEIGEADIVPGLVDKLNGNSDRLPAIIEALTGMYERYERILNDGAYIADLFRKNIKNEGINNLLAYLNTSENPAEISSLLKILGWIDDVRISKILTNYLGNPETRRQAIEALVSSGQKVSDILISQLKAADDESRKSAIVALGRIGGPAAVDALIPLLKDDEVAAICCGALAKIGDPRPFRGLLELLGHEDACIRRAAISAINSIGHPDMEKQIQPLLSDPNPFVRESAVRITGYFGFSCCKSFIHRLCSDIDLNVRIAAIENLPVYEDERIELALTCYFEDENPRIRAAVARSAGQMESKSIYTLLTRAVNDPDGWVRYYAIQSADKHGFADILPMIKDIANFDPVPFVRLAAIEYLGNRGGQFSSSALATLTGDKDVDIALAAIRALGKIHHPEAIMPLLALSKSTKTEYRKNAIEALGNRGGQGSAAFLQWFALTEKDIHLKASAIDSLRKIGTDESIRALLNLTSDQAMREQAIEAIVKLPPEKLGFIREGLNHKHTLVRTAVIEVLLRMHTPQASEILFECLKHDDVNVRISAIYALHRLGNRSFLQQLMQLKEQDPDPLIKKTIQELINLGEGE